MAICNEFLYQNSTKPYYDREGVVAKHVERDRIGDIPTVLNIPTGDQRKSISNIRLVHTFPLRLVGRSSYQGHNGTKPRTGLLRNEYVISPYEVW